MVSHEFFAAGIWCRINKHCFVYCDVYLKRLNFLHTSEFEVIGVSLLRNYNDAYQIMLLNGNILPSWDLWSPSDVLPSL